MEMAGERYLGLRKILAAAAAFLAAEGFNLLYRLRGDSTMFSNSVLSVVLFLSFLFLIWHFHLQSPDKRTLLYGLAGGFCFASMTCMGFSLNYTDTIWHGSVFGAIACLTPFFGVCTGYALLALGKRSGETQIKEAVFPGIYKALLDAPGGRRFYLFCWLLLFLSWVPVLLASWPGIFSYDCGWQLVSFADGEITGHHPILHTALLGLCREAGQALAGSNQAGALIYSLIQMLVMSGLYGRVCLYLKERSAPLWLQAGTLVFLAFHPVNGLMALCATKDSVFTALFAVFVVQLLKLSEDRNGFFSSVPRQCLFCLNVLLLFAFRNNAFHTFLLCIPFFLGFLRENRKRMGILIVVCLSFWLLYTGPFYRALGIAPGDPREKYSVLMQSAARVYNLDYQGLTREEREAFLSIIREEGMEAYLPRFADTVKACFDGKKFQENPGPFLKAWFSAGIRHKKIYIDSFLVNTFGYWYPGNSIEENENGRDYFEYYCKEFREDVDVVMEPKLTSLSEFYRKIGNEASFQRVPVVSAFFNLGCYTWLLLFALLFLLYRRQYGEILILIPLVMYFVTTLLGPVVKMRYHYPLIACAPLILYLIWRRDTEWTR